MAEKTVNLNIRTNKNLKESVGEILRSMGLDHSTVVNMLYRQILLRKEIPFSIKVPNKLTQKAINVLEGDSNLKTYGNSDDLFKELGA